jgi:hypothetical protein
MLVPLSTQEITRQLMAQQNEEYEASLAADRAREAARAAEREAAERVAREAAEAEARIRWAGNQGGVVHVVMHIAVSGGLIFCPRCQHAAHWPNIPYTASRH